MKWKKYLLMYYKQWKDADANAETGLSAIRMAHWLQQIFQWMNHTEKSAIEELQIDETELDVSKFRWVLEFFELQKKHFYSSDLPKSEEEVVRDPSGTYQIAIAYFKEELAKLDKMLEEGEQVD